MNHGHRVSWAAGAGTAPPQFNNLAMSNNVINNNNNNNGAVVDGPAHPAAAAAAMENNFHLGPRFSNFKVVGRGSFGEVCSALDSQQGKRVAIKKVFPMSRDVVSAKHALREIRLMRYLEPHPNIISLEDLLVNQQYDELYIVMELLDCDLHYVINKSNQPLDDVHHRYFMFQILKGVKFLHDNRVIHRDLKPSNILATKRCQLRITDFGLARLRPTGAGPDPDNEVDNPMTETAVTRWYRPPELMLCPDGLYGYAVDLWSVGCIFAEMLGRQPFFPGQDFKKQLSLIFDAVGSPQPHEVAHIRNPEAIRFLESMQGRVKVPFADLLPNASEASLALLERLLVFDPPCRFSADEALSHRYFQPLSGRIHVPPDPEVAPGLDFDFESEPMHQEQLRNMILQEVALFHGYAVQEEEKEEEDDEDEDDDEDDDDDDDDGEDGNGGASMGHYDHASSTARAPPPTHHHRMMSNSGIDHNSYSNYMHNMGPGHNHADHSANIAHSTYFNRIGVSARPQAPVAGFR
ncbi:unnamed protein product [Ectocarpus sp. 6 AP-2014]